MIFLASDHAGYPLKEAVKKHLAARGLHFADLGCESAERCDYPDYGHALARAVLATPDSRGIAVCGSGHGIAMSLNRHAGIRAARCRDIEDAVMSRAHNAANVLVLAGRQTTDELAAQMVDAFLAAEFEGERHIARVAKIELADA